MSDPALLEPPIVAQLFVRYGQDPQAVPAEQLERYGVTRADVVEWAEGVIAQEAARLELTLAEGRRWGVPRSERRRIRRTGLAHLNALRARLPRAARTWRAGAIPALLLRIPRRTAARASRRQPAASQARASRGSPTSASASAPPPPPAAPYDPVARARELAAEVFGGAS